MEAVIANYAATVKIMDDDLVQANANFKGRMEFMNRSVHNLNLNCIMYFISSVKYCLFYFGFLKLVMKKGG